MKIYAKGFVKEVKENGTITGAVASTGSLDRDEEILDPNGWELDNFLKAPRLLWSHKAFDLPIGRVDRIWIDKSTGELKFDATFAEKENDFAKKVADLMRGGFLNTFSVGFIPKEREGNRITKQELLEISVVNVPANPEARLNSLYKSLEKDLEEMESKGVIPYKETPKAPEGEKWDAPREIREADIDDLKIMCAWYDSENPDVKSSYKLPHHRAKDHYVVWKGVAAAMGALLGARGGVNIPDKDKKGVYNHLVKHYKQFDKEPPEFREYSEEELKSLEDMGWEMKPEPEITENYIRIRVEDPDKFVKDSFRTIDISKPKGIKAIIGKYKTDPNGPTHVQSYLFDKDKWTLAEARRWVDEHKDMDETVKKLIELSEEIENIKEGRILSEKNRILIRTSIDTMRKAISALEELLKNTQPPKGGEPAKKKAVKVNNRKAKLIKALRIIDKAAEYTLHELKEYE